MSQQRLTSPRGQRGAALMVVLMLLLVMTLLALASLRATQLSERMSGGLFDRGLAFQAAEAALREAEGKVNAATVFPTNGNCEAATGLCPAPVATAGVDPRWLASTTVWKTGTAVGGLAVTPQYIIEPMGSAPNWPGCDREMPRHPSCLSPRFRITARVSAEGRAEVMLQSNYTMP